METQLLQAAVSNLLWALALALFATLAALCIRRPALTHALWVLVLVKLFTPPLVALPIWSASQRAAAPRAMVARTPTHDSPVETALSSRAAPSATGTGASSAEVDPLGGEGLVRQSVNWRYVQLACIATWIVGSMICAAVAFTRISRFVRLLRDAIPAPASLQSEADVLGARFGLRRAPKILLLPGPICPMLWAPPGAQRIVLPAELWAKLAQGERDGLLLHEMAHLKRRDHWVRLLELLATIIYWWNPLVWWARSRLRQAEELCCDAWVTWASPRGSDDYAAALVEAVDFASRNSAFVAVSLQPALPVLASGMGQFHQLKRRLIMIQSGKNNRKLGAVGLMCICAATAALPLATVGRGRAPEPIAPAVKGDKDAERRHKAATAGLDWLAGHLPIAKGAPDPKHPTHQTAIVSICGLAFLASGSDLKNGPYQAPLNSCLDSVLADCQEDGLIAPGGQSFGPMYDHGYATLFLAEAYARTHDDRIKPKLKKAVALLENSQGTQGGWRYVPTPRDADVSITACELNALSAARAAGIDVRPETLKKAVAYLIACQNADGGFTYTQTPNTDSGPARSAAAAAALQHAGGQPKEVDSAMKYLDRFFPAKQDAVMAHGAYAHYYASQALAAAGGESDKIMLDKMCAEVIAAQSPDGAWEMRSVSKEYETACSIIALEARDGGLWIFGGALRGK